MKRITVDEVLEAYRQTGLKPMRGTGMVVDGKTCALGAIRVQRGVGGLRAHYQFINEYGRDYIESFQRGFDGKDRDCDDQDGYDDGAAAAEAVFNPKPQPSLTTRLLRWFGLTAAAVLLFVALSAPASAQTTTYLLWQYETDPPGLSYVLRNWTQNPGDDFLTAEFAWIWDDPILFGPEPLTSGVWWNSPNKFNFTTIPGQQGGGAVLGESETAPEWAADLPDKYPPGFFDPQPTTARQSRKKK